MARTSKPQTAVEISRSLQIIFTAVVWLSWLAPLLYMLLWANVGFMAFSTWVFQASYIVLPLLFFLPALVFCWRKTDNVVKRLFLATFIGLLGYTSYMIVSTIENILRIKFYPPVIMDTNDTSWLTAFGHEWAVMGICAALFVIVLVWVRIRKKG